MAENVKDYIISSGNKYLAFQQAINDKEKARIAKLLKEVNPFDKDFSSDSKNLEENEEMTSIRFRNDGRFELRFYIEGKQYSVYSKDRSKLLKKRDEKIKDIRREKRQQKNKTSNKHVYTLSEWFKFWYDNYKKPFITLQTCKEIEGLFKNHINKHFGKFFLDEITIEELQKYLNRLPKTRTKELIVTYFNACLQKAEDFEHIKKNPFKLVVRDKKIKNVRKAFTIEEQETLLKHIKKANMEHYKLFMFYLATGVRRTEALTITSDDFSGQILHIKGTKTDNADRHIKITQALKNLVFKPGKLFDYNGSYVTHVFKEYLNELKLDGTLHCLRHSYATNQYYIGTPAKQVQMNMGHAEIGITMDIYTNIVAYEDKSKIVEKIKKLYNKYYIELEN